MSDENKIEDLFDVKFRDKRTGKVYLVPDGPMCVENAEYTIKHHAAYFLGNEIWAEPHTQELETTGETFLESFVGDVKL